MNANYLRGPLPDGEIIAEFPQFVGNTLHGWMSNIVLTQSAETLWISFPQPTYDGDFVSYRLDHPSTPAWVEEERRRITA